MENSDESNKNFFKHVFNFDDDSKSEMLNIMQYSLLAIIPIVILNKISQKYVPEADEDKGTLEISVEVILQIMFVFLGILMVNRIITYIPTYSGDKYPEFNVVYIILAFLTITLSLQTKLGEKVSILFDRVLELWNGPSDVVNNKKKPTKQGTVRVSQPISNQSQSQQNMQPSMTAQMEQSLYATPITQLPTTTTNQQSPDYNNMYRNDTTSMPGAATPGLESFSGGGIMAANEVMGGGAFGSSFGGF
jgi:hypothetical protein